MLADGPYGRLDASGARGGGGSASPRPTRSSWPHSPDYAPGIELFARIREGLISGEHLERMGMALWLYEYLHLRCYFTGPQAGTSVATFTHVDAAKHFGVTTRQVKRWMRTLVEGGYVMTVRAQYGLTVTITKYGSCEATRAVETVVPKAATRDRNVTREQSPTDPEVTFPVGTRDRNVTPDLPLPLEKIDATSPEVTFPAVTRDRNVTPDLPLPLEALDATKPEVTFPVGTRDRNVTPDLPVPLEKIDVTSPEGTFRVAQVTFLASRSHISVTPDPLPNQSPTNPEVTFPVAEVTFPVRRSDISGQPLLYVAPAFRDSEKKESVVRTQKDTSPQGALSALAVGAVPVDGAGVRVASRRASPSPWGLLTSNDRPKRVEPVEHVTPTVTDTVTDTVADEIPVSMPVVAKASPKPRVRKVVVPKAVVGVDGHGPVMSTGPVPESVGAVWDAEAMPLGEVPEVPEASTAIVLVTRATVTDVTPVTPVTPVTSVALARRRRTASVPVPVPVTEANLVLVAKEPNRQAQVIDLLRADPRLAAYSHLAPRDFAAIKRSSLTPAQIVEVYGGLCLGEWGSEWDQKHVRVDHAIGCWAQYQRSRDAVTQAERDIETLLAAHSVPWVMTERDRTLIRDVTQRRQSPLGAEEIVAAYEGLLNGTWGSDWLRSNVSITKAIESFGSYQASLRPRGHDPTRKKTHDQEWADIFAERDKLMPEGSVQ